MRRQNGIGHRAQSPRPASLRCQAWHRHRRLSDPARARRRSRARRAELRLFRHRALRISPSARALARHACPGPPRGASRPTPSSTWEPARAARCCLAAEAPFRKVVGVELNADLARIARRNVTRWSAHSRPRTKIRVMQADALEFRWPRTPLLVYLYNPFACELVEQLAARLAAAVRPPPPGLPICSTSIPPAPTRSAAREISRLALDRADRDGRARPAGRPLRHHLGSRVGLSPAPLNGKRAGVRAEAR